LDLFVVRVFGWSFFAALLWFVVWALVVGEVEAACGALGADVEFLVVADRVTAVVAVDFGDGFREAIELDAVLWPEGVDAVGFGWVDVGRWGVSPFVGLAGRLWWVW
jgi:hypothetical protein